MPQAASTPPETPEFDLDAEIKKAAKTKAEAKQNGHKDEKPDAQHLLTLDSLAPERPYLTLDDERHDFRLTADFDGLEHREFNRLSAEYDRLWDKDGNLNAQEKKRYLWLLDWLVDRVLRDPKALRDQAGDRLTGAMKRDIIVTFSNAPQLMMILKAQEAQQAAQADQARDGSTSES